MELKKLQNGSDIRGVAWSSPDGPPVDLTPDAAAAFGKAFVIWLSGKTGLSPAAMKIAVGRDPRLSGPTLSEALTKAMASMGVKVLDCGLASTPAMFMSTVFPSTDCQGSIMITASHLPMNRNGFKFFSKEGGLNKEDISHIISLAENPLSCDAACPPPCESADPLQAIPEKCDLMALYCGHMRAIIGKSLPQYGHKPLEGLRIMVDCGNGAGGFYVEDILATLGSDVYSIQFLDPEGTFPNNAPNPEDKVSIASARERVMESDVDLGLIFDTDVDRSAAIDKDGTVIARNGIVALAASLISKDHPGTLVVTDSVTSNELHDFLENHLGMTHFRYKRGYRNVINKAIGLNKEGKDCCLAIETSGHGAFKDNYFLDDGAYLATLIVIEGAKLKSEGKTIGSLIEKMAAPAEAREVRMVINREDFGPYGDEILSALKDAVVKGAAPFGHAFLEEPNYEGVRINFDTEGGSGWCLLRKSLHDPLLALNMESSRSGDTALIADALKGFLSPYKDLDTEGL